MSQIPIIIQVAILSHNLVLANTKLSTRHKLLWKFEADMRRFQSLTTGHVVIMGRKTFETLGKPLPNRTNVVISRNQDFHAQDCVVIDSLEKAINWAKLNEKEQIFIIGGGQIYLQALPFCDRLYLTIVEGDFEGDVFFPVYQDQFKTVLFEENHSENDQYFKFLNLSRV